MNGFRAESFLSKTRLKGSIMGPKSAKGRTGDWQAGALQGEHAGLPEPATEEIIAACKIQPRFSHATRDSNCSRIFEKRAIRGVRNFRSLLPTWPTAPNGSREAARCSPSWLCVGPKDSCQILLACLRRPIPTSPPPAPFRKRENRGTGGSKCRSGAAPWTTFPAACMII